MMNRPQLLEDLLYLTSRLQCCSKPECHICREHVAIIDRLALNLELTPSEKVYITPNHILTRIGHWE